MSSYNEQAKIVLAYWKIDGGNESDIEHVKRIFDSSDEERKAFLLSMIKKYGPSSISFNFLKCLFCDKKIDYNELEERCSYFHRGNDKKIDLVKLWTSRDMNEEEIMYLNEMMDGKNGIRIKGLIRKYGANIVYRALMNNKTDSEFDWIKTLNECTEKKKEIEQEVKEELIPDLFKPNSVENYFDSYLKNDNIELLSYLKYAIKYYGRLFIDAYHLFMEWKVDDDHTMFDYLELNEKILNKINRLIDEYRPKKEFTDNYLESEFEEIIPWIFYERANENDIDIEDILEICSNPKFKKYDLGIYQEAEMLMDGIDEEDDKFKKLLLFYETCNFRKESALKYLGDLNVENTTVLGVPFNQLDRIQSFQIFKPQSIILSNLFWGLNQEDESFFQRLKDRTEEYRNNNKPNRIIPVENIPDATIQIINALEYEESVKVYYIKDSEHNNTQVNVLTKDNNNFIEKVSVKKYNRYAFYIAICVRDKAEQTTDKTEDSVKPSRDSRNSNDER